VMHIGRICVEAPSLTSSLGKAPFVDMSLSLCSIAN